MKITTDLNEANDLLRSFIGAQAHISLFSITHHRLGLRLELSPSPSDEVAYVVGVACDHITGHFLWYNANVSISKTYLEDDEVVTRIFDERGGFELITSGGFALAIGFLNEFGASFDNFIE